ncbi:uncharacterized protein LOC143038253 [Oratosquilla oratoria]|uniref:uncharacterized protein LOC143038253 n=1 Tax=Oratosquilla oratoria TaxID=337810 RepID=UPI003F762603
MRYLSYALGVLLVGSLAISPGVLARKKNGQKNKPLKNRVESSTCRGTVDFELITGFVYSSAEDIMQSKVGTLELSECLAECLSSDECQAINFETGLCVLFLSSAGEISEELAESQFPVFTIYAQKVCLTEGASPCTSPWAYETVPGLALTRDFTVDTTLSDSRIECVRRCMQETNFNCKAVSYDKDTKTCALATADRNMAGRRRILALQETSDYVELACKVEPSGRSPLRSGLCEFQEIRGRIMKTVDSVFTDVETFQECKERCLNADFACRTFDYESAGEPICRLSHHSSATLAHVKQPYLEMDNATTHEMQDCYQVTVDCLAHEMRAQIQTSSLFNGRVYSKERPRSCVTDVKTSDSFEIVFPYNSIDCSVKREDAGQYSVNVVIQHHDTIVTSADVGLSLHCKYELGNQTVTNAIPNILEVRENIEAIHTEETIVASPNVTMEVTDVNGGEIHYAVVGDSLALRFEITDPISPYQIFVRELVAMDGKDQSEILLIDSYGCPTDQAIMQSPFPVDNSGQVLHAPFHAFKFPSAEVVQFQALITPCMPRCEPVNCQYTGFDGALRTDTSYGRRKRREVSGRDILVVGELHMTDNFKFARSQSEEIERDVASSSECTSFLGIVITCAIFIMTQLILLLAWSYLWHKKRASKEIDPRLPSDLMYTNASVLSPSYMGHHS